MVMMQQNDTELDDLWRRYKETGDKHLRDRLVVVYAPLVRLVALKVATGLPNTIEHADLMGYGAFGLIDAIEKFDLERNLKFATYAVTRIRGSIFDELRAIDWVPRSVRAKSKDIEQATSDLLEKLRRNPTGQEIADALEIDHSELQRDIAKIFSLRTAALDEPVIGGDNHRTTLGDTIADHRASAHDIVDQYETRRILAEAINRLTNREKTVMTLYYYEELTLAEIGGVLGVTESRVCQIHSNAAKQLREILGSVV
jgi:RNA polymerase sigma factor for flagellar operon FliA